MKVTKFEHSCLDITEGNSRLVVDPGIFSKSLTDFNNIVAVVVTHVHSDHFDPDKLGQIVAANPQVQIFTTDQVAQEFNQNTTVPERNRPYPVGDITLRFLGEQHELFGDTQNIGVMVNDKFFIRVTRIPSQTSR